MSIHARGSWARSGNLSLFLAGAMPAVLVLVVLVMAVLPLPAVAAPASAGAAGSASSASAAVRPAQVLPTRSLFGLSVVTSGTVSSNATWTTAGSPYLVTGDLTVPAGVRLAIMPGVKLYFKYVEDTAWTGYNPWNPTRRVDMIVHGQLVANGTSTKRILFSTTSSVYDTTVPMPGHWGALFFDSMSASSLKYADVNYGCGVWSENTARPVIDQATFTNDGTPGASGAALYYHNIVTDTATPRVQVTNTTILAPGVDGLSVLSDRTAGDCPISAKVWGVTVRAAYGMRFRAIPTSANTPAAASVNVDLKNDTAICSASQSWPLQVQATTANSSSTAGAVAKALVSGGRYEGHNLGGGMCAVSVQADSNLGDARADLDMTGSTVKSSITGVRVNANAIVPSGQGKAYVRSKVVNTGVNSRNAPGIWSSAWAAGSGTADVTGPVTGSNVSSTSGGAMRFSASSDNGGGASVGPALTNDVATSFQGGRAVEMSATSHETGTARGTSVITGCTARALGAADGNAWYFDVASDSGTAMLVPRFVNSSGTSSRDAFYARASLNGPQSPTSSAAICRPYLRDADLMSADRSAAYLVAEVNSGDAGADCAPYVRDTILSGGGDHGLYCESHSDSGTADCRPSTVLDVSAYAEDRGLSFYALADDGTRTVRSSPVIKRADVLSVNQQALFVSAAHNGDGAAQAAPVTTDSFFQNERASRGVSVEANTNGLGAAEVGGSFSSAFAWAENEAWSLNASHNSTDRATARVSTALTMCMGFSRASRALDARAYSDWGSAVLDSNVKASDFTAPAAGSSAVYFRTSADGTATDTARSAPVITSTQVDGRRGLSIEAVDDDGDSDAGFVTQAVPRLTNVSIAADGGDGLSVVSNAQLRDAKTDASIRDVSTAASRGWYMRASTASNGDATVTVNASCPASTKTVNARGGDGIVFSSDAMDGAAYMGGEVKGYRVLAADSGVTAYVNAEGAGAPAKNDVTFRSLRIEDSNGLNNRGVWIMTGSDSGPSQNNARVLSNIITKPQNDGVYCYTQVGGAPGPTSGSPEISWNNIAYAGGYGVSVFFSIPDATCTPTIFRNTITRSRAAGIRTAGTGAPTIKANKVTEAGWGNATTTADPANFSGIEVQAAKGGSVLGNLVTGNKFGVGYNLNNTDPFTSWNDFAFTGGVTNVPWNYWTNTVGVTSTAINNWWGTIDTTLIASKISGSSISYAPWLTTLKPKITTLTVTKLSGNRYKLVLFFDRIMDTTVKKLYFGPKSPYKQNSVTGTWSGDERTFTAIYKVTAKTKHGKQYLTGLKDWPGSVMYDKTHTFKIP